MVLFGIKKEITNKAINRKFWPAANFPVIATLNEIYG